MRLEATLTDAAILSELGRRLERRRLELERTQADVAREAGIGKRTLERVEAGESADLTTLLRILRALDLLDRLETLIPDSAPGPLALLRLQGRERRRAPGTRRAARRAPKAWSWGDGP